MYLLLGISVSIKWNNYSAVFIIGTWKPTDVMIIFLRSLGFPCDSAGKESACNAGDMGSIPGLGSEMKWSEVSSLSHVRVFGTPWTVAHQAPPFMGFSRQEYWSGLSFPVGSRWGNSGNSVRLYFSGLQNHCRWWLQPWNLKMLTPWKESSR